MSQLAKKLCERLIPRDQPLKRFWPSTRLSLKQLFLSGSVSAPTPRRRFPATWSATTTFSRWARIKKGNDSFEDTMRRKKRTWWYPRDWAWAAIPFLPVVTLRRPRRFNMAHGAKEGWRKNRIVEKLSGQKTDTEMLHIRGKKITLVCDAWMGWFLMFKMVIIKPMVSFTLLPSDNCYFHYGRLT